jgi:hypothetical protein
LVDFLLAIKDAKHPRHEKMMDRHGPFDPSKFDPLEVSGQM